MFPDEDPTAVAIAPCDWISADEKFVCNDILGHLTDHTPVPNGEPEDIPIHLRPWSDQFLFLSARQDLIMEQVQETHALLNAILEQFNQISGSVGEIMPRLAESVKSVPVFGGALSVALSRASENWEGPSLVRPGEHQ